MAGLFDKQSEVYAAARPTYPDELYNFLASVVPQRHRVWDVGTGNGQAALKLAEIFDEVIATDVSAPQLEQAPKHPNIKYAVTSKLMTAEELHSIIGPKHSLDLITVAQALHWFDFDTFYAQVEAFLRREGIFAAWCYMLCATGDADVDAVITDFYATTGPYWDQARRLVDEGYRTIPFPFEPAVPDGGPVRFESCKELNLEQLLTYFRSWSAIQTSIDHGVDLLGQYRPAFEQAWGDPTAVRKVTWPVHLLVGKPKL